jgi:hypothetical protein
MVDFLLTRRLEIAVAARGASLAGAQPLAGDGSDRRFFRLLGSPTVVLLSHPHAPAPGGRINENDSYFFLGRHLRSQGTPVPEIYEYCPEEGWLLLEDLGDISLDQALKSQPGEEPRRFWYRRALEVLVDMQIRGKEGFNPSWCFDTPVLDWPFLWERECGYFVRAFLGGYLGQSVAMDDLAPDFDRLLTQALPAGEHYFLHRDFQSRNLMIKNGRLRVIDFQGGRLGPLGYDVAALLIDPYVALNPILQREFLDSYLDLLEARLRLDREAFRRQYRYLALCRNLQILGAYGFLSRAKGKKFFERFIPAALAGLCHRLEERPGEFPRLERVVGGGGQGA